MSGTKRSKLDHLLLGLLRQRPMTGYDVRRLFEQSPMIRFSPSPGSIYPALRRLQRAGLIRGRVERRRSMRPRQVYELTPRGRCMLADWLSAPIRRQDVVFDLDGLLLRFSLMGGERPIAEQVRLLKGIRDGCAAYARELRHYARSSMSDASLTGRLSLQLGIEGYAMHARWAARSIARLRRKGAAPERTRSRPRDGG